jgi:succinate dehydrogenase hydrophobic membrane anchor protein
LQFLASTERMEFIKWLKKPVASIAVILFVLCSFYHACLGMDEVIEDYIPSTRAKTVCLILNRMLFFVLGVTAVYSVLAIGFRKF